MGILVKKIVELEHVLYQGPEAEKEPFIRHLMLHVQGPASLQQGFLIAAKWTFLLSSLKHNFEE